MSHVAIRAENLSKAYQLGEFSTGTLTRDIQRKIALMRGKEDPYLKIGETNDRTVKSGGSDIVWSLKDINFDIKQGDAVGIIGRNGAGKSTLLKVLSRVTTPTTGSVKIKGRVASLLEVGTGFHPELTGRENIFLNGAILGMRKHEIKKHFDAIVDFAGVERYIDTPVKRYSSGMYVRLAFAVAAHLESEILIVDEVLAVGDAEFQKKCLGKMSDVSKGEGRTVLFVSHNMGSVKRLCTSGIYLKNGQMHSVGDIEAITDTYIRGNTNPTNRVVTFAEKVNKAISITKVSVSAEGKASDLTFDIKDKLKVQLSYVVQEDIKGTHISFALSKDGVVLFRSWDIDTKQDLYINRKKGEYTVEIDLPQFLLPGTYSVYAACGKPGVGAIDVKEDCLIFDIENIATDGAHSSFTRGGLVKVDLNWNY